MKQKQKRAVQLLAAGYAAIMIYLLFFREINHAGIPYALKLQQRINLVPFSTITRFVRGLHQFNRPAVVRSSVVNLFGNIALFLPLGIFPPLLWKAMQKLWRTLLLAAGIMAAVEVIQLLLLVGWCDIDDLILNLAGAALGYGLYSLFRRNTSASTRK